MKYVTLNKLKIKGSTMKIIALVCITTAILTGCSVTNGSNIAKKLIHDTPLLVSAKVREINLTHVAYDALDGRVEVIEPKSRANGYMAISPYILTKGQGVSFQVKEKLMGSISSKLKPGQIYDPRQISDAVIDLALKKVSQFIDAENLPYDSLTIAATIHGYADDIPFKKGASIPSPITCNFSLMNASMVDRNGTVTPVTVTLKKGDAITNNNVLAMVRTCYVAKQLQSRVTNSLYPAFVNGSFSLNQLGHTGSPKRGVDVVIKLKSPEL